MFADSGTVCCQRKTVTGIAHPFEKDRNDSTRLRKEREPAGLPCFVLNVTYKIPQSVLVVIYTKELDVLLIERADRPGFWQSVTGSRDSLSEPLVRTAIREVFEETGIRIVEKMPRPENHEVSAACLEDWKIENVFEIFSVWRHRFAPGVTENTEHVFGLQVPEKFPVVLAPREHLDSIWLPYREAAEKCFSYTNRDAILQLPRQLRPLP